MRSNVPVVVAPVAAEVGAQGEPRSRLHGLVGDLASLAKVVVVSVIAYGALLGILLHHYG